MSGLKFKLIEEKGNSSTDEKLHLSDKGFKGTFKIYEGTSEDFNIAIIPSLNITGYGKTPKEAFEDLEYNTDVFFQDIFKLPQYLRDEELTSLGWKQDKFFKKRFSNAFVDENGVLQNFDNPQQVQSRILETA